MESLKRKIDHKETIGLILLKGLCHEMNNFLKAYYDKYVLPVHTVNFDNGKKKYILLNKQ
jgi:hypothetical protein